MVVGMVEGLLGSSKKIKRNNFCPGIGTGSLNVPIEHHPTKIGIWSISYYKVMSNIPKMGQLPTPV